MAIEHTFISKNAHKTKMLTGMSAIRGKVIFAKVGPQTIDRIINFQSEINNIGKAIIENSTYQGKNG